MIVHANSWEEGSSVRPYLWNTVVQNLVLKASQQLFIFNSVGKVNIPVDIPVSGLLQLNP